MFGITGLHAVARQTVPPVPGAGDTNWAILAGLRMVLAWIVVCGHVSFYFADVDPITLWVGNLGGKAAVLGFLLVSGYSIAASIGLQQQGFYRRRLLRIYPLYITAILFAFATERAFGGAVHMPSGASIVGTGPLVALGNAVFGQTFIVKPMAFDGPIWSLAVEVAYYLMAPLLLRLDRRIVLALFAVSVLAYIAPRRDDLGSLYWAFSRLNALIYGWAWLMGFMLHGTCRGLLVPIFAAIGAASVALNPYSNPEALAPVTFLASFTCVLVAATIMRNPRRPHLLRPVLLYLGDLSYPLYLIHFPALIVAAGLGLRAPGAAMIFAIILSMAALHLVDHRLKRAGIALFRRLRSQVRLARAL